MKYPALMMALILGIALAQSPSPIKLTASLDVVTKVTVDGKTTEKLVDAAGRTFPGTLLQTTQKISNTGKVDYGKGTINMAVDPNTRFVSQQCDVPGYKALYSIDARVLDPKTKEVTNTNTMKYAEAPLRKKVTVKENGVDVQKEVTVDPSEYTSVSWVLPGIKAGQTITCYVRSQVK